MRPVDRGEPPAEGGGPVVFREYRDAAPYLEERLGYYCSYCETAHADLHVEHKVPKGERPDLECEWTNLLLACASCNSVKRNEWETHPILGDYLWPDTDRTDEAFEYLDDGSARVAATLPPGAAAKAERTLQLTGCARAAGECTHRQLRRLARRLKAWQLARLYQGDLQRDPRNTELRLRAIEVAKLQGFWSIWRTVFHDDPDMLDRLNRAFPGTRV